MFTLRFLLSVVFLYEGPDRPPHSDPNSWLLPMLAVLLGLISIVWASVERRSRGKRLRARQQGVRDIEREFIDRPDIQDKVELLVSSSPASSSIVAAYTPTGDANTLAELRNQISLLGQRIEGQRNEIVEVQKIDPALEATLKLSVENVTRRLDTVERQSLSKWDVALVVLQLFSGLGVIFGIAKYLMK
jgi:hypothetical protein